MSGIKAYGAQSADSGVHPMAIQRRAPRPDDVAIKIDCCGVCHTDIHFAENDWGRTLYPVVPGHEIIGRVTAVGDDVSGSKSVMWWVSAAWWIPAATAPPARTAWNSIAWKA